jgi:hypothetical protein
MSQPNVSDVVLLAAHNADMLIACFTLRLAVWSSRPHSGGQLTAGRHHTNYTIVAQYNTGDNVNFINNVHLIFSFCRMFTTL